MTGLEKLPGGGGGGGGGGGAAGSARWEKQAAVAVDFHHRARAEVLERGRWARWTLAFPDAEAERAFAWYFSRLRGETMRRGLLLLASLYMLYALVEWGSHYHASLLVARGLYVLTLLGTFTASAVCERAFRRRVQAWTAAVLAVTGVDIVVEGGLQKQLYSPYLVIVLLLFLVAAPVFVRLRFVSAAAVAATSVAAYDVFALAVLPGGDDARSRSAWRVLVWYNVVFAFAVAVVLVATRRAEVAARYQFLHSLHLGRSLGRRPRFGSLFDAEGGSEMLPLGAAAAGAAGEEGDGGAIARSASLFDGFVHAPVGRVEEMLRESGSANFYTFFRSDNGGGGPVRAACSHGGGGDGGGAHAGPPAAETAPPAAGPCDEADPPPREVYELVTSDRLPAFHAPYEHVHTAYRALFTIRMCWASLFRVHNETVNVWTELVPFGAAAVGLVAALACDPVLRASSRADVAFVGFGALGVLVVRPLVSGLAHLLHCQDRRSFVVWWMADYFSICLCVLCASLVYARFSFYCLPMQQIFFMTSLVGLFLSTVITVLFVTNGSVRTGSFVIFSAFANGVPFAYAVALRLGSGTADEVPGDYLRLWTGSIALLIAGLVVKGARVPERIWPGRFDLWGASHQWWHVLVNAANILTFFSWRLYLEWRHAVPCSAP